MIQAVIRDGAIQPLEPLPSEWKNGRKVVVEAQQEPMANGPDDFESWCAEMAQLTAELNSPEEWLALEATLQNADRQAKENTV